MAGSHVSEEAHGPIPSLLVSSPVEGLIDHQIKKGLLFNTHSSTNDIIYGKRKLVVYFGSYLFLNAVTCNFIQL